MTTIADLISTYTTQSQMSSFFIDNIGIYNVVSYGAVGDGSTDDYTALYNASAAVDDNGGIVFFPTGTYKIGTSITFPSNVFLWFAAGAKLSPDSGKTITINGSLQASLLQIFIGNGTIALNGTKTVFPQWWGALGDGVNVDRAAIQTAINAMYAAGGGKVLLPIGTYLLDAVNYIKADLTIYGATSLMLKENVYLVGELREKTILKVQSNAYGAGAFYRCISSIDTLASNMQISNLTVDGNKTNQTASTQCSNILLEAKDNITISNIKSINSNGVGIMVRGTTTTYMTNVNISDNIINICTNIGIQCSQFDGLTIKGNIVRNCNSNGIDIYGEDATATSHAKNYVIQGNIIDTALVGIFNETVRDGVVNGNSIYNTTIGITVNRINGEPRNINITGNEILTCSNTGFRVTGDTGGVSFTGNLVAGYINSAMELQGTSLINCSNNFVRCNHATNPIVYLSGAAATFCKITNNTVIQYPIAITKANQVQIAGGCVTVSTVIIVPEYNVTFEEITCTNIAGLINNTTVSQDIEYNKGAGAYTTVTLVDKQAGLLVVHGYQSGVGRRAGMYLIHGNNTAAEYVTIAENGAAVFTMATSGMNIRITATYANTNLGYALYKFQSA